MLKNMSFVKVKHFHLKVLFISEKLGKTTPRRSALRKRGGSLASALKESPTKQFTPIKEYKPKKPITLPSTPIPVQTEETQDPPSTLIIPETSDKKSPPKRKPSKPGFIDDGLSLFSTPDVIRRVVSKSDPESPTKEEKLRTLSTESNKSEVKEEVQIEDKPIEEPKLEIPDIPKLEEPKLDEKETPKELEDDSGNDNTNLDLDLNADELIPEDLLFQVAKLVENADIQKVIDTNLTLVDQNLDLPEEKIKPEEPKIVNSVEPLIPVRMAEVAVRRPSTPIKVNSNTTNQPIQIVRPDGRVIIIPPIEKPATRSSKRKQESPATPVVAKVITQRAASTPLSSREGVVVETRPLLP